MASPNGQKTTVLLRIHKMADIFISSAVRTAIGSFGGSLSGLSLSELATHVGKEAINRAGIAPDKIEQTVFGNVIHTEPRDMYMSLIHI